MPEVKDQYANQAYLKVVESAANTLTYEKLLTGISIFEKVGWVISRIDYLFTLLASNFAAEADRVEFGLSTSDALSTISMANSPCIDFNRVTRNDFGTAASGFLNKTPYAKDFSGLPGGGLLVPPNPLYIWVAGNALGAAVTVEARMFYTVKQLKTEDYWELVEIRHMIGA